MKQAANRGVVVAGLVGTLATVTQGMQPMA